MNAADVFASTAPRTGSDGLFDELLVADGVEPPKFPRERISSKIE